MSPSPTAQVKSKPAPAAVCVSGTDDSQQNTVERPPQVHAGAVPPQVFVPPASTAIQTEAQAPHTTVVGSNITLPVVSSPVPVRSHATVPTQFVGQAPVLASISSPAQAVNPQATVVTVVGATTGVSSATLLSTVTPVQSPVPSVVPIKPGPVEASHTTSPPVANPSGLPHGQCEAPVAEPSIPSATAPAESIQTTQGKFSVRCKNYGARPSLNTLLRAFTKPLHMWF